MPTVELIFNIKRVWRGVKGRGEKESAGRGGGGGSGRFDRGNQGGIRIHDLERGRVGCRVTWGRLMWRGIQTGL